MWIEIDEDFINLEKVERLFKKQNLILIKFADKPDELRFDLGTEEDADQVLREFRNFLKKKKNFCMVEFMNLD